MDFINKRQGFVKKCFMGKYMLIVAVGCAFIIGACTEDASLVKQEGEIAEAQRIEGNTYVEQNYTTSQLKISLNVPYSVRPNYNKIQYTADNRKGTDVGQSQLTIHLDIAVPPNATSSSKRP